MLITKIETQLKPRAIPCGFDQAGLLAAKTEAIRARNAAKPTMPISTTTTRYELST
jgi:hypothetical protein